MNTEPAQPIVPVKYFIYPINSLIGHAVIDNIKENSTQTNPCIIIGKADKAERAEVPNIVDEIIKTSVSLDSLFQKIEECDVIIYELLKTDPREIEYLINTFEEKYFDSTKRIIFISSPLRIMNGKITGLYRLSRI